MRSPLKEVNGGTKSLIALKNIIPAGSVVNSFGLFDGAIEIDLAANNRFVIARTHKYVIYEFWRTVTERPDNVAEIAASLFPIPDTAMFTILQENWPKYKDPCMRSALFFLLNRCSDTGMLSSGEMTNENFNRRAIVALKNFKVNNFHLIFDPEEYLTEVLPALDPQQWILFSGLTYSFNLLEHGQVRSFEDSLINHALLKRTIEKLPHKAVLVYKYHPQVFDLYKEHEITMVGKYGNIVRDQKKCQEIIVAKY